MFKFEVPDMFVKDYKNDFQERQGSLLNALETAEKEYGKDAPVKSKKVKSSVSGNLRRSLTKPYRGKESIFKSPEVPPLRKKIGNVSKIRLNRGKWTKYTLSDVPADDMSERSNANAAFSFLQELEGRKNASPEEGLCNVNFKPVFKKPPTEAVSDKQIVNAQSTKKNSHVKETPKIKSADTACVHSTNSLIRLNHLDYDEEDE